MKNIYLFFRKNQWLNQLDLIIANPVSAQFVVLWNPLVLVSSTVNEILFSRYLVWYLYTKAQGRKPWTDCITMMHGKQMYGKIICLSIII